MVLQAFYFLYCFVCFCAIQDFSFLEDFISHSFLFKRKSFFLCILLELFAFEAEYKNSKMTWIYYSQVELSVFFIYSACLKNLAIKKYNLTETLFVLALLSILSKYTIFRF